MFFYVWLFQILESFGVIWNEPVIKTWNESGTTRLLMRCGALGIVRLSSCGK